MRFVDYFLKHLTVTYKPKRALDVGAGNLNQAVQLSEDGVRVDAVEPNPPLKITLSPRIRLHVTTAECFSYPSNAYDLIVFRMVSQRLPARIVKELLAIKFPRALKQRGVLYIMVPASYRIPIKLDSIYDLRGRLDFDVPTSDFKIISAIVLQKRAQER